MPPYCKDFIGIGWFIVFCCGFSLSCIAGSRYMYKEGLFPHQCLDFKTCCMQVNKTYFPNFTKGCQPPKKIQNNFPLAQNKINKISSSTNPLKSKKKRVNKLQLNRSMQHSKLTMHYLHQGIQMVWRKICHVKPFKKKQELIVNLTIQKHISFILCDPECM